MTLNKELCVNCWTKIGKEVYGKSIGWVRWDEIRWDEGTVRCPDEYLGKGNNDIKITDKPPNNCPFILEHILNNEDK